MKQLLKSVFVVVIIKLVAVFVFRDDEAFVPLAIGYLISRVNE